MNSLKNLSYKLKCCVTSENILLMFAVFHCLMSMKMINKTDSANLKTKTNMVAPILGRLTFESGANLSLLKRKGDIFATVFISKTDKPKMFMTSREHNQTLEVHRYYICFSK